MGGWREKGYKIVPLPEKNRVGEASDRNRVTYSNSSLGIHPGELQARNSYVYTNARSSFSNKGLKVEIMQMSAQIDFIYISSCLAFIICIYTSY